MRQAQEARLHIRVVAELAPEAHRVMLADNRPRRAFVGLAQGPVALERGAVIRRKAPRVRAVGVSLLHRALRVVHELVDDAPCFLARQPSAVTAFKAVKVAAVPLKVSSAMGVLPS